MEIVKRTAASGLVLDGTGPCPLHSTGWQFDELTTCSLLDLELCY